MNKRFKTFFATQTIHRFSINSTKATRWQWTTTTCTASPRRIGT